MSSGSASTSAWSILFLRPTSSSCSESSRCFSAMVGMIQWGRWRLGEWRKRRTDIRGRSPILIFIGYHHAPHTRPHTCGVPAGRKLVLVSGRKSALQITLHALKRPVRRAPEVCLLAVKVSGRASNRCRSIADQRNDQRGEEMFWHLSACLRCNTPSTT